MIISIKESNKNITKLKTLGELNMKKNVLKGIIATASLAALSIGMVGCSADDSSNLPPKPTDKSCNDWQWNDSLGVWQCKDTNSVHNGNFYYHGYFGDENSLKSNSNYQSYTKSSDFAGGSHASDSESVSSAHEGGFGGHGGGGE